MSSGISVGKEKVGGWGSSRRCHERTEMLMLPVFLRENTKSQLDKKEAREGRKPSLGDKGLFLEWGLSGGCSCVASWVWAT